MYSKASAASRRIAKQSRPAIVQLVFSVVFVVALILVVLWMDWILVVAMYRNSQAMSAASGYQKSQGSIIRCEQKKRSHIGQVFIEYTFRDEDGQNKYTSDRIYHPIAKLNQQAPEYREWHRSFPVGQKVVVYYDPADPEGTAVLRPGLQGFYLLDAMTLAVFHALAMAAQQAISKSRGDHGGDHAAVVFFLALALLCFLTTALVGASMNPTLHVMRWAWTFVLVVSCAATVCYSRNQRLANDHKRKLTDERERWNVSLVEKA